MNRDEGFHRADVDTGILRDPKFRKLERLCRSDAALLNRCRLGYLTTLLASWELGERVALEDAAPADLGAVDEIGAPLAEVRLLDESGRIPEHVWAKWFGPAAERRDTARDRWRRWNERQKAAATDATVGQPFANGLQTPFPTFPTVPTVPSEPSLPVAREEGSSNTGRDDGYPEEWHPFLREWYRRFRLPPSGGQDQPGTQRAVLWEVVRSYPKKAAEWLAQAPADLDSFHAVNHVRKAWRRETRVAS